MPEVQNLPEPALAASPHRDIGSFVTPASRICYKPAESHPWWLWWNLLSLDAPTVAVLWASLFARASAIRLNYADYIVLALSVWIIYVCDRLLDVLKPCDRAAIQSRHRFCFRHSKVLAAALVLATTAIVYIAAKELPAKESWGGLFLAAIVTIYMVAIHRNASFMARLLPKEFIVGILFAIGTTLPLWSRNTSLLRTAGSSWTAFALLCSLNCVAIECWERPRAEGLHVSAPRFPIAWVNSRFTDCALVIVSFTLVTAMRHEFPASSWLLSLATSLGALSLLCIHTNRSALSASALRVLADAALVLPALLFWVIQP